MALRNIEEELDINIGARLLKTMDSKKEIRIDIITIQMNIL
jgi:hypothetical protein